MNNLLSYCGLVYPRISASDKDLPVKQRIPQIHEEESDHDINQDVNRKIRSVLSEHIANKPSQLEKISKYYFDGEVGEI